MANPQTLDTPSEESALKTAERLGLWGPRESKRIYRWAYAAVGIADFRVRPVTVSLGRGRTARGFVGWAAYRAYEASMLKEMWLALSAADEFGLGASRPLGFGAVRITPLENTRRKAAAGSGRGPADSRRLDSL
ncbi:MAG: hypothetical protein AT715_06245 [Thermoproteus sp. JCHS_4]|jgi:Uncharacterized conserved protein|nr:MAG: hypothetical protein AT715_06245 [Thermoproteus sp. JCHS_4]